MTDVVYFQAVDKVGLTRLYRLGLIHYFYVLNIYKFVTINMFNCYDTIAYKKIVSATKLETLSQFVNICFILFLREIHVNYVGHIIIYFYCCYTYAQTKSLGPSAETIVTKFYIPFISQAGYFRQSRFCNLSSFRRSRFGNQIQPIYKQDM